MIRAPESLYALLAALLALVLALLALIRSRPSRTTPPATDAQQLIHALEQRVSALDESQRNLLDREATRLAAPGLVHFCAYGSEGPALSFSLALVDARRNGVVLTSLYGRDQVRLYVKSIAAGRADVDLADEEQLALDLAEAGGGHRLVDCQGTLLPAASDTPALPRRRRR